MLARLSLALGLILQVLSLQPSYAKHIDGISAMFDGDELHRRSNIDTYPMLADSEKVKAMDIYMYKNKYDEKEKSWVGVEIPSHLIGHRLRVWAEVKVENGLVSFMMMEGFDHKELWLPKREELSTNARGDYRYRSMFINYLGTRNLDPNKTYTIALQLQPLENQHKDSKPMKKTKQKGIFRRLKITEKPVARAQIRRLSIECLDCH